jgi:hypothetical protein
VDRWELIGHLVDVAMAEDPSSTADRLLSAVLAFSGGRRAALFEVQLEHLRLFASRGIDEAVLAEARSAWLTGREPLLSGTPVLAAHTVVQPLVDQIVLGLLVVERTGTMSFEDARDLQALAEFSRLGVKALRRLRSEPFSYLARTNPDEVTRDQLIVLLEGNEWNIARVARLLGVTRPTIYARLQRFGLPRRRTRTGKRQTV